MNKKMFFSFLSVVALAAMPVFADADYSYSVSNDSYSPNTEISSYDLNPNWADGE